MREMKQRTLHVLIFASALICACVLLWAMPLNVSAAANGTYSTVDRFANTTSIKGIQGTNLSDYGVQHALVNCKISDCVYSADHEWVKKGFVAPFEYEGETYYFGAPDIFKWAKQWNEAGITTSVVFLLEYDTSDPVRASLVDEDGRVSGYTYYMPDDSKLLEAFFAFICEECINRDGYIDNFILGNEVNSPLNWNYCGTTDAATNVAKYCAAFDRMCTAVRKYTDVARCSISLDHSWQNDDEGRAIAAKTYLDLFAARMEAYYPDDDWCISFHLYPSILYETDIWAVNGHDYAADLNPKSDSARIIDGNNLYLLTNYVKENFGEEHRIMLTEQGFTDNYGEEWQAAALAYSYYAAMYDPMVDCFLVYTHDESAVDSRMNFSIEGKLAGTVYRKIDDGNEEDAKWIDDTILPIIGVSSWSSIVPNYGTDVERGADAFDPSSVDVEKVTAFVTRLYEKALSRTPDEDGLNDWVDQLSTGEKTGAEVASGFFFSPEMTQKNLSNEDFVELLYEVMMDRASDEAGKADWVSALESGFGRGGVYKGFAESDEFEQICEDYGIRQGKVTVTGNDYNRGLSGFIARLYTTALGRDYEESGLDDWCDRIRTGEWSLNDMSTTGFFASPEFQGKNLSNEDFVAVLYNTFMDRDPDESGYDYWIEKLESGTDRLEIVLGFSNSEEFAAIKEGFGL